MSTAAPPPVSSQYEKSKAVTALVLSILGILCCGPLSVAAWVLAAGERKAIAEGRRPREGDTVAVIALVLAIIGTIFLAFSLVWVFFLGGLAMLGTIVGAATSH